MNNIYLLSKYSRPIFWTPIQFFILQTVQNLNKGVYSSLSKLFFIENLFYHRYKTTNIKTKEFLIFDPDRDHFAKAKAFARWSIFKMISRIFGVF